MTKPLDPNQRRQREHMIGCNLHPHVTPGGFSEYFGDKTRESREEYREPAGFQDVALAATRFLDDRSRRVMMKDGS